MKFAIITCSDTRTLETDTAATCSKSLSPKKDGRAFRMS